jgi:serine/threonine-protein kinase
LYLAVEPAVRRRWPHRVVGWNRLLEGRLRDPLVGRDALIGGAAAVACVLLWRLRPVAAVAAGFPPPVAGLSLEGVNDPLGHLVLGPTAALLLALNMFFLFFVLARVLRREWAAAVVAAAVLGTPVQPGPLAWLDVPAAFLVMAVTVVVMFRYGLLPMVLGHLFGGLLLSTPLTLNVGAWYGPAGLLYMLTAAALAGYGFVVSQGGRPLVRGGFFGDE